MGQCQGQGLGLGVACLPGGGSSGNTVRMTSQWELPREGTLWEELVLLRMGEWVHRAKGPLGLDIGV